jgi:rhodanese-related sulfurtransferase
LKTTVVAATFFMILGFVSTGMATDFPHRKDFPTVPPINSEELIKEYEAGNAIIVDVRSKIEFEAIHPKKAVHGPLANVKFAKNVDKLAKKYPGKKIVFYCNGITCLKSYKATKKAMNAGIQNVYAYDAGIPEWASLFPEKTLLLGKEVVDPEKQIIPKSEFKKKCLSFQDFKGNSTSNGNIVIDVRDHIQRTKKLPGLEKAKTIPLDAFIPNFVQKRVKQDNHLYIFDQVGKQVRWLEYYLVENDYENYTFLKGGATAVLKTQNYK